MILPIEQQVCSLESAKRLKELNFSQESLFYWYDPCNDLTNTLKRGVYNISMERFCGCKSYSAYTVAELGILLPPEFAGSKSFTEPHVHYAYYKNELMPFTYFSEAESRAKMLIYLADQRLINPEEIK